MALALASKIARNSSNCPAVRLRRFLRSVHLRPALLRAGNHSGFRLGADNPLGLLRGRSSGDEEADETKGDELAKAGDSCTHVQHS